MVLSNKKLKQKLRAEIAESLTSSATIPDGKESANPDPNSQTQSLKQILDLVTQKPRLSKREYKRRRGHDSETLNSEKSGGDVDDYYKKNTGVEEESNGIQEESKNFDVVCSENRGENGEKEMKIEEGESSELGEGEGGVEKESKKPKTDEQEEEEEETYEYEGQDW